MCSWILLYALLDISCWFMALMMDRLILAIESLVVAINDQVEAINALAESNQALVQAMIESGEIENGPQDQCL
jgi:hypothetical protein